MSSWRGNTTPTRGEGDDDVDMMDNNEDDVNQEEQQPTADGEDEAQEAPSAAAPPPKRKVNRRPKLTADRLLDDEYGLKCLMLDFEKSFKITGDTVRDLDTVILNYGAWAGRLYPYGMPLADFARTCETELYPEIKRRRIYDFRLDYVTRKGRFGPVKEEEGKEATTNEAEATSSPASAERKEESRPSTTSEESSPPKPAKLSPEEMRLRMEANRLKALEKRRLKEQERQQAAAAAEAAAAEAARGEAVEQGA